LTGKIIASLVWGQRGREGREKKPNTANGWIGDKKQWCRDVVMDAHPGSKRKGIKRQSSLGEDRRAKKSRSPKTSSSAVASIGRLVMKCINTKLRGSYQRRENRRQREELGGGRRGWDGNDGLEKKKAQQR